MVRKTLDEIRAGVSLIDEAKIDGFTEDDIRRFQIEDGYDPDELKTSLAFVRRGPNGVRPKSEEIGKSQARVTESE